MFQLRAQVLGTERSIHAEADGLGSITIQTATGVRRVDTWQEALRLAHNEMGEFLRPAERPEKPWGLLVVVSEGQAAYGQWPLGGGGGSPSFQNTPLVRIRNRWHDSGPLSALANAMQIVREYVPRGRAAA